MRKYVIIIIVFLSLFSGYFCVSYGNDFCKDNTECLCYCHGTEVSVIKKTYFSQPLKTCQFLPQEQQTILKDLIRPIFHPPC